MGDLRLSPSHTLPQLPANQLKKDNINSNIAFIKQQDIKIIAMQRVKRFSF